MSATPENPSPPPPEPAAAKPVLDYQTPGRDARGWVLVWTARNNAEANLAVTVLQSRGLHARVDAENAGALGAWVGGGGVMSANVQVLEADVEAARAILTDVDQRRSAREAAREVKCPRCGKGDAKLIIKPERWAAIGLLVASCVLAGTNVYICFPLGLLGMVLLIWPTTALWRCRSCGNRWRAPEPEELVEDENDDFEFGKVGEDDAADDDPQHAKMSQ